jgi:hypothetical protein
VLDNPVDQRDQRVPVAGKVDQHDRLAVVAQLTQGHHLEHLVERAKPARQHDEAVGTGDHLVLAVEHVARHDQLGDRPMADLALEQAGRNQPGHLAAGGHRRVGDGTHQADPAAAIDQLEPGACGQLAQSRRRRPKAAVRPVLGAAKDAQALRHPRSLQEPAQEPTGSLQRPASPLQQHANASM